MDTFGLVLANDDVLKRTARFNQEDCIFVVAFILFFAGAGAAIETYIAAVENLARFDGSRSTEGGCFGRARESATGSARHDEARCLFVHADIKVPLDQGR
jgi:hypothetical protein